MGKCLVFQELKKMNEQHKIIKLSIIVKGMITSQEDGGDDEDDDERERKDLPIH